MFARKQTKYLEKVLTNKKQSATKIQLENKVLQTKNKVLNKQKTKYLTNKEMSQGYRGTTHENDFRLKDKQKKLMKEMKFPTIYNTEKLDIEKVNLDVMRPWINEETMKILGFEGTSLFCFTDGLLL